MSVEAQKPIVPVETAPIVEPIAAADPVTTAPVSEEKPVEAAEPKADEVPKAEGDAAVAAPVEEKKEEKVVEPIYSGALGYKAPGLKNIFRFSKKYFWFGEEPVPASSLSQYLRGEEPSTAHSVAAWSSVTGKGLLYFVKHADQKQSPTGVLKLADATELSKDGIVGFHFKLHGSKHAFEAQTAPERNGWFAAVEKAVEEAKASKEEVQNHETYKSELEKLGKPATLAATTATTPKKSTEVAPKKSTDLTHKPTEGEVAPVAAESSVPARTGSSSSSSSDEEKKKKASKSKSRSVSRGKRSSIFGGILGKKDKVEEKHEEKKAEKEEKKEEKEIEKEEKKIEEEKKDETPVVSGEPSATAAAPVITEDTPIEVPKAEETPVVEPKEEKKLEEKPKPTKRASIFGNFVEKIRSPTQEKKQPELAAPAASKEPEVSAEPPKIEAPKTEEAPIAPVTVLDGTSDVPKAEEPKPATTPAKEKQHFSFGKFLGGSKEKAKSPSTEHAPEATKTEEVPKVEETPAPVAPLAPVEPAVPAPAADAPVSTEAAPVEEKKEEPAAETTPVTKKRGSIFGALGGSVKKDKDAEEKPQGLKGLFRSASKAGKSKKEKEPVTTPAKVEETAEPKEEKTEVAPLAEEKKETDAAPAATSEQAAIGDVVPDAVSVGQAPKSTPEVATTA